MGVLRKRGPVYVFAQADMPEGWIQLLALVRADGLKTEGVPACEYAYLNLADGITQQVCDAVVPTACRCASWPVATATLCRGRAPHTHAHIHTHTHTHTQPQMHSGGAAATTHARTCGRPCENRAVRRVKAAALILTVWGRPVWQADPRNQELDLPDDWTQDVDLDGASLCHLACLHMHMRISTTGGSLCCSGTLVAGDVQMSKMFMTMPLLSWFRRSVLD